MYCVILFLGSTCTCICICIYVKIKKNVFRESFLRSLSAACNDLHQNIYSVVSTCLDICTLENNLDIYYSKCRYIFLEPNVDALYLIRNACQRTDPRYYYICIDTFYKRPLCFTFGKNKQRRVQANVAYIVHGTYSRKKYNTKSLMPLYDTYQIYFHVHVEIYLITTEFKLLYKQDNEKYNNKNYYGRKFWTKKSPCHRFVQRQTRYH